jgi:hypothetical protein
MCMCTLTVCDQVTEVKVIFQNHPVCRNLFISYDLVMARAFARPDVLLATFPRIWNF